MSKTMRRVVSLILVVIMLVAVIATAASCKKSTAYTYTYNTYTTQLGTNWNPHTWETDPDSSIAAYLETPLADITVKNSTTGEYQWIFVAAESIKDVTAANKGDLTKYNVTLPEGQTADQTESGYVFEIKLRPEMKWENGTLINADTYIYSMEQLLNPAMKNYRANLYYSGESAVAGGADYYYQGAIQDMDNYDTNAIAGLTDLVKGNDGVYKTTDGLNAWFAVGSICSYLEGYSMVFYDEYYTGTYDVFEDTAFAALVDLMDENGNVAITDESWALMATAINTTDWGEDETYLPCYIQYQQEFPACEYDDTVGCYKVDDYTIRYVCQSQIDFNYFLTSCTSNWLVYEELYESLKKDEGGKTVTTYGTSKETSMSYGAYRISSLQKEKQIVFVQNENYWEYTKNEDGTLSSMTFFEVDGEKQPQFITEKIVVDVMTDDAAKLAFLSGKLDDWTPPADEVADYASSEQLYKIDETYTYAFFFNTDVDTLKKLDAETDNDNSVVVSNYNFRKAMSLAIDRSDFVTNTAGYKPAYELMNTLYFYDVYNDPASIYRNTEEAMKAIVDLYGIEYGEGKAYATLQDAYKSVNGYNLTEAKALMKQACEELVDAGLYTEGQPIKIKVAWTGATMSASDNAQVTAINKYLNAAIEGSGFGTIEIIGDGDLANRHGKIPAGEYAIGYCAWGGAAFYPFRNMQVYCDTEQYEGQINELGCWDPATETLTIEIDGQNVTKTWQDWSRSCVGTGAYANASFDVKLHITSTMEREFLAKYYRIPTAASTVCSMLSYKTNNYTNNYSIMYGFGGMRLMTYNYTNAEWSKFVKSMNGNLNYT